MKRNIDSLLVSANSLQKSGNKQFVDQVMGRIHVVRAVQSKEHKTKSGWRPVRWVKQLHGFALIAFIILSLLGFSGVVYAAVHYIPVLIHVDSVQTNQRGQTEYTSKSFAACKPPDSLQTETIEHFALKTNAPKLSTDEVAKILQAKCELTLIDDLARSTWPTYNTHKVWKAGDTIYYARADLLGSLASLDKTKLIVDVPYNAQPLSKTYTSSAGQELRAVSIASGRSIALNEVHAGSAVMVINRVAEQYQPPQSSRYVTPPPTKDAGTLGMIVFDLPIDYYTTKQGYLTDIANCVGNGNELCPQTASIDIYPRKGGEGASNPYLTHGSNGQFREIAGTVTAFTATTMTLKSIQGTSYSVALGENGFDDYNQTYAPAYIAEGADAKLRIGSFVTVRYMQPSSADPKSITSEQVEAVVLMLDDSTNLKTTPAKQY